ncbi:MAG TPA: DUF3866 family protein [Chthonomonadaceae bacterium]|nr:DUF3866 family protein [Chthonomonadaceae bacterium]
MAIEHKKGANAGPVRQRAEGVVEAIRAERPGAQELTVRTVPDDPAGKVERRPALNLIALTGRAKAGDRVLLNTVAVELGLGTGGLDFIIANLDSPLEERFAPGHILKLRYTPLQTPVLAVCAPESPHHPALRETVSLEEYPVVCAELHSQVPVICAAARWALQEFGWSRAPRIAYIMTDGASLPLALSRLVPELKARGWVDATLTAGQAFGGDYEAVNLYSALAAARAVVQADIIVVSQGPGNVGTQTPLGFSGVDQGLAVNAAASLGGIPIAVARISFADPRDRHQGLSHHTVTVLSTIARAPALVPIPRLPAPQMKAVRAACVQSGITKEHEVITVDAERGLAAFEASGLDVTTMGRTLDQERPFFLAAAAAGLLAAQLVEFREEF